MHLKNKRKKIMLYFVNNFICVFFIIRFLSDSLMPVIYDYGKYKCSNFMISIINYAFSSQIDEDLKNNIIVNNEGMIDVNVDILNSLTINSIMKSHQILYGLESGVIEKEILELIGEGVEKEKIKRGIIYEIPIARAFDNLLISSLGFNIPVRYKLIGEIKGEVISEVKEYGINNALIEISAEMRYKSKIAIPMITEEVEESFRIPLVIKLVQGEIPDYLLGTNLIGG